ncbi:hypothetical protein [Pseudanabaena yagii]|nr:hypothetical protein [Pseudanabaena yagii]
MKKLYEQVKKQVKLQEDNVRFYWIPSNVLSKALAISSELPNLVAIPS